MCNLVSSAFFFVFSLVEAERLSTTAAAGKGTTRIAFPGTLPLTGGAGTTRIAFPGTPLLLEHLSG
uniref:Secreted protein n=1 Tax=Anopheles atroparvus TaxID=41427 RepID=A0AAG5DA51_ANOAO